MDQFNYYNRLFIEQYNNKVAKEYPGKCFYLNNVILFKIKAMLHDVYEFRLLHTGEITQEFLNESRKKISTFNHDDILAYLFFLDNPIFIKDK